MPKPPPTLPPPAELCAACACDTDPPHTWGRCEIAACRFSLGNFANVLAREGEAPTCLLFRPKGSGPRLVPCDPFAGQMKAKRYHALPRDPVTGRPVI